MKTICRNICNSSYICAMRKLSMEELGRKTIEEFRQSEKVPVIVVLENIRSAYNVGSVFRTSDAFLIEAIYITGYSARPPHKEVKNGSRRRRYSELETLCICQRSH